MPSKKMTPLQPGEILLEEFLKPMSLSQNRLALDIRVPARRINEIVHGKRRITPDPWQAICRYLCRHVVNLPGILTSMYQRYLQIRLPETNFCNSSAIFDIVSHVLSRYVCLLIWITYLVPPVLLSSTLPSS